MNHRDKLLHGSFGDSIRPPEDTLEVAHEAHDHDGDGEVQKKGEGPKAFKPNATMYLRSIKAPERADEIRRHGMFLVVTLSAMRRALLCTAA